EKSQLATAEIRREEQKDILAVLDDAQKQILVSMIGRSFDPAQLGRVTFRAPELDGSAQWLNSQSLQLKQLRGKVVALHFWAFGCINCIHNYPWYHEWDDKYAPRGLVV